MCVCERERARERVCVCARDRERVCVCARERVCVCECVCERESVSVCERETNETDNPQERRNDLETYIYKMRDDCSTGTRAGMHSGC